MYGLNVFGCLFLVWMLEYFGGNVVFVFGWNFVMVFGVVLVWVELYVRFGRLLFEIFFEFVILYGCNGFLVLLIVVV